MSIPREQAPWTQPPRRRVLIATPVSERVARLVTRHDAARLRPELATRPTGLADALVELRPHTLVVGVNAVDGPALERWATAVRTDPAEAGRDRPLLLVRRGTSLAAVDLAAAARHRIEVRNTPEVNARHVARFIVDRLFDPLGHAPGAESAGAATRTDRPGVLGLVGAGNINSRVAREGVARGWHLAVHAPSLAARPATVALWAAKHRLPVDRIHVARTVEDVLDAADLISIAAPLVHDGPRISAGMIDMRHVKSFTGRRLVSVSEPHVFTDRALVDAYDRRDLEVVIDNAPRFLGPVRELLAGRIAEDGGEPRRGFTLCSVAMHSPACSNDLDQAFLAVVGRADLDDLTGNDLTGNDLTGNGLTGNGPKDDRHDLADRRGDRRGTGRRAVEDPASDGSAVDKHDVVVVGGGIVGLTIALVLRLRGHPVRVLDAAPADRADPAAQGTTFAGTNGRHLSATETLPQADASRAGVLDRDPTHGGWRLRDPESLSEPERAWAGAFEQCADRPGLHAVARDLVIALNRLGLRGWEHLFALADGGDGLAAGCGLRWDARIPRIYLGPDDLAAGERLQRSAGGRVVRLSRADLVRDWPALGRSVPLPDGVREVTAAVEVDGYAVNIHDLATVLIDRLRAAGVEVRAGTRVERIETDIETDIDGNLDGNPDGNGNEAGHEIGNGAGSGVRLHLADGSTLRTGWAVVTVAGRDLQRLLGAAWPGAGAVAHLLGLSLTLPNPGLRRPVKVHAGDPLGVINVTLSADGARIHVSGGFGYLGTAVRAAADSGVARLRAVFEQAVAGLFPTLRRPDGSVEMLDVRVCERPATPDGLPLVEAVADHGGRVIVAAGTNAGGTVQAPAVAMLVADLLAGTPRCATLAMAGDRAGLPPIRS
ncbi:FAD-dependent oxidoreductase [Frankia sp. CgMI4]|uniref:FAD-dependent oxidoreductase n=1 Tax=Frankia sp. CgMI4 TaxID=1742262 RepID=UPI0008732637|nr:FAD-dependent oxidoreductase [Frankia sp. CgIM4]OFB38627.1 FAD-dependent oxidoreductase [Frankia sp. CgIM4]